MDFDYRAGSFWLSAIQWTWMVCLTVWGYLRTKDGDNAKAVAGVEEQLNAHMKASRDSKEEQNMRLTRLEEAYKHLPKDEDISKLSAQVNELTGRVDGQTTLLKRIERQNDLIQEHLLNKR